MSTSSKTKAPRVAKTGVIDPERLYTADALGRIGIGRVQLMEARRSGLVKPVEAGHRMWYVGAEVIEWILSRRSAASDE